MDMQEQKAIVEGGLKIFEDALREKMESGSGDEAAEKLINAGIAMTRILIEAVISIAESQRTIAASQQGLVTPPDDEAPLTDVQRSIKDGTFKVRSATDEERAAKGI